MKNIGGVRETKQGMGQNHGWERENKGRINKKGLERKIKQKGVGGGASLLGHTDSGTKRGGEGGGAPC